MMNNFIIVIYNRGFGAPERAMKSFEVWLWLVFSWSDLVKVLGGSLPKGHSKIVGPSPWGQFYR